MRSNAGMATKRRAVDLRFAKVSALRTLAWLGMQKEAGTLLTHILWNTIGSFVRRPHT